MGRTRGPLLIGREREFGLLTAAFEQARRRQSSLVVVQGEAGIGKSRLVAALAEHVDRSGGRYLVGHCPPPAWGGGPFAPLAEMLGRAPTNLDAGGRPVEPNPTRIWEYARHTLIRLGEASPVVAVFEDVHWADAATRDLLRFLARQPRDGRVLLVLTARTDEPAARRRLDALLSDLVRAGADLIDLPPLTPVQTRDLLVARQRGPVPDRLAAEVHSRGGGNPFYCELLQDASASGAPALPGNLRILLRARFQLVSHPTRRALDHLAVLGRPATQELLQALTSDARLARRLREALGANLIVVEDGLFRFRHELLREAVLADTLPGDRARLHRRAAEVLTDRPHLSREPPVALALQVAAHWHEAGAARQALQCLNRAAESIELTSPRDALEAYLVADRLADRLRDWPSDVVGHGEILRRAAESAFYAGDVSLARRLVQRAIAKAGAGGPSIALLLEHLARYLLEGGSPQRAQRCLEEASEQLTPDDPAETRARILSSLALSSARRDPERSRRLLGEAVQITADVGDGHTAFVYGNLCETEMQLGDLGRAVTWAWRSREAGLRASSPSQVIRSYSNEARAVYLASGRLADSIEVRREGLRVAEEYGQAMTAGAEVRVALVEDLIESGEWAEAASLLEGMPYFDPQSLIGIDLALARRYLAMRRGEPVEATTGVEELIRVGDIRYQIYFLSLAIPLLAAAGEGDAVTRLCDLAVRLSPRIGRGGIAGLYLVDVFAAALQAIVECGVTADGRDTAILDAARRVYGLTRPVVTAPIELTDGVLEVVVGQAARVRGGSDLAAWTRAGQVFREVGARPRLSYTLLRQAEIRLAEGDRAAATAALREAHRIAAEVGAHPLRLEAESLAGKVRLRLAPRAATGSALTARESQVLNLLSKGMTDKEIAVKLMVSHRTVSTHLARVFAKLGVHNRAEAIARFYALALGTDSR